MKISGLSIREYIDIIKWPIVIFILIVLLGLFIQPIRKYGIYGILGAISILMVIYAGWRTVKKYNGTLLNAAIAGLLLGFIADIPLLFAIILFYIDIISSNSKTASGSLARLGDLSWIILLSIILVGLVLSGIILAILGAFIAKIMRKK